MIGGARVRGALDDLVRHCPSAAYRRRRCGQTAMPEQRRDIADEQLSALSRIQ
jgi:hypothetical protein